ncbi:hypothetical protein RFI_09520 [Reticulomyxa filosa]|uniref:Uncharacterized protein n=1 Tax=Reticulomyxa filosa TaxID=46433 RepID=X6NNM8_RETFI|nr:hypothetical protein RFI_09520 [Reticulomyxa filosa]|eukprot:ETO27611.1 hypothetical protein RFI_09520 [Reticulomyxa filosa]
MFLKKFSKTSNILQMLFCLLLVKSQKRELNSRLPHNKLIRTCLSELLPAVTRLENATRKLGGGGGDDEASGPPPYVSEYTKFVQTDVAAAAKASDDLGVPDMGALIKQGFDNILELIQKLPNAKKPEQVYHNIVVFFFFFSYYEKRKKNKNVQSKDLVAFLGRAGDAISKADNARYRGKDFKKVKFFQHFHFIIYSNCLSNDDYLNH